MNTVLQSLNQILALVAGAVVAGMVVLTAVMGWGGDVGRWRRIGLCAMGAGLVWAGPSRFLGYPPGLGDLIFLCGLSIHLTALYGHGWRRRIDGLDGTVDGRIGHRIRRQATAGDTPHH